jgi:hypothetical protein
MAADCCTGCDLIDLAGGYGIEVMGKHPDHGRFVEALDKGCGLSAAQRVMLAARIDEHRDLLAKLIPVD